MAIGSERTAAHRWSSGTTVAHRGHSAGTARPVLGARTAWAMAATGLLLASAGCARPAPRPASVTGRVAHAQAWSARRVGCLDLRVAPLHDRAVPAGTPVFAFDFVDRCSEPAAIDLSKVQVEAVLGDQARVPLPLFDPAHEVHSATLGAGREGAEALAFEPPRGPGAAFAPRQLCVDVGAIGGEAARVAPICVAPAEAEGPPAEGEPPSIVVGYRRYATYGAGWEEHHDDPPRPHQPSRFDWVKMPAMQGGYTPGSFLAVADPSSAGVARAGCAEVRVEALRAQLPKTSLPLSFEVGNRCTHALTLALRDARVTATWADGTRHDLLLFDPDGEVVARTLDGRAKAVELLEYTLPPDAPDGPARSVCVDVSRIAREGPAGAAPICLSRRDAFANRDTIVGHEEGFDPQWWRRVGWRAMFEMGLAVRYLDLRGVKWSGATPAGQPIQVDASKLGHTDTFVADLRLLQWLDGPFYAGGMLEVGAGPTDSNLPYTAAGVPVRSYSSVGDIAVAAVGGVSTSGAGPARLRFDVAAGARFLLSELYPAGCGDAKCEWDVGVARLLIAPRVVLESRVTPWFTFAAWADADALYLPDFGVGLAATLHTWAFDGIP